MEPKEYTKQLQKQLCANPECKKEFIQKRYWQDFCCAKCRVATFNQTKNQEFYSLKAELDRTMGRLEKALSDNAELQKRINELEKGA